MKGVLIGARIEAVTNLHVEAVENVRIHRCEPHTPV